MVKVVEMAIRWKFRVHVLFEIFAKPYLMPRAQRRNTLGRSNRTSELYAAKLIFFHLQADTADAVLERCIQSLENRGVIPRKVANRLVKIQDFTSTSRDLEKDLM